MTQIPTFSQFAEARARQQNFADLREVQTHRPHQYPHWIQTALAEFEVACFDANPNMTLAEFRALKSAE